MQLTYPSVTLFRPLPGQRCCDNCTPRLFSVEKITLPKGEELRKGKKRQYREEMEGAVKKDLTEWRDHELLDKFYPGSSIVAGSTLLDDDVIERLAKCGERIETREDFVQHARWAIGFGEGQTTAYGKMLLERLQTIYSRVDAAQAAIEEQLVRSRRQPVVQTQHFYAGPSNQRRQRRPLTVDEWLQRDHTIPSTTTAESTDGETSGQDTGNTSEIRGRGRGRGRGTRGRGRGRGDGQESKSSIARGTQRSRSRRGQG